MISRRQVVLALGASALAGPLGSFAQQPGKVWRIGFLSPGSRAVQFTGIIKELQIGLRDLGYVEGRNLVTEYRWAEGKSERLADLAADLVSLNVDLIVSNGTTATIAVARATSRIPIVVGASGDLVAAGLAASLARPGGNVTGQVFFAEALGAKGLELVKEAVPSVAQVAVLLPLDDPEANLVMDAIAVTAKHLRVSTPQYTARGVTEFEAAFAAMKKQRVGALLIPNNPLFNFGLKAGADLALKYRLPSCGNLRFAEAGGLLGFGVNFFELYRRVAVFIDKIFKGANPGDIAIEQATKFDLAINLKTAKALSIKMPYSILVRATKLVE